MTDSKLCSRFVRTANQNGRDGVRPSIIVHHHMATTGFNGVLESWRTGRKQGSAHAAIDSDGEIVGVVPEESRAWSLSNRVWDSKALITEIANESAGGSWPVSSSAHLSAARLTADWCSRYSIPCDRQHVLGHREVAQRGGSYATACPGGLDLDWIVNTARAIMESGGYSQPASTPTPRPLGDVIGIPKTDTESDGIPGKIFYQRLQLWGRDYGSYNGPLDGVMGVNSWKGVQTNLARENGYTGPIDGVPGVNTWKAFQRWAAHYGYTGPIDGVPGVNTWKATARALNTL